MCNFIVMKSSSEWQSVRQDIYASKDTRNYNRALRRLLLWKTRYVYRVNEKLINNYCLKNKRCIML